MLRNLQNQAVGIFFQKNRVDWPKNQENPTNIKQFESVEIDETRPQKTK